MRRAGLSRRQLRGARQLVRPMRALWPHQQGEDVDETDDFDVELRTLDDADRSARAHRRVQLEAQIETMELRQMPDAEAADAIGEIQQPARRVVDHDDPAVDGVADIVCDRRSDQHRLGRALEQILIDLAMVTDLFAVANQDDDAVGELDRQGQALPDLAGAEAWPGGADE